MGARGPKPGFKQARAVLHSQGEPLALPSVPPVAVLVAIQAPAPAPTASAEPPHRDPLQRSRDILAMHGAELKDYAKQVGIRQRDIDELSEDKLRQNCAHTVASLIEALTE